MDGTSLTPQQEKLKQLKQLLPEAFAEGKIDWEKFNYSRKLVNITPGFIQPPKTN